jgi:hypothetical protein
MAPTLDLRAGPPQRPTLRVVYREAAHGFVALCVVFQLAFPGLRLDLRDYIAEDSVIAPPGVPSSACGLQERKEKVLLTILHNILEVDLRNCTRTDLANEFRFLVTGFYDALVRVDDFLLLLGRDDRLFEL